MKKTIKVVIGMVVIMFFTILIVIFINKNYDKQPNNSISYYDSNNNLRYLLEGESIEINGLKISLGRQEDPPNYVSIPNHSEQLNKETIKLPSGRVQLIKFRHGGTAANPSPDVMMYWIYVQRAVDAEKMNTYYIEATVTVDNDKSKDDLLDIAKNWRIPRN